MCITINHAKLSKTKILSLALENGNHFISYSNSVKNLSGKPNAMILPIPGRTYPELFHNTESYKDFMDEIIEKCDLIENYMGIQSKGMRSRGIDTELSFESFQLGMYSVGLSKNFQGIREFLNQLSEEKRPVISESLKEFFEEKYAGWSFAVCVFDSDQAIDTQPIAFEYEPFNYGFLYYPTMDGHDGSAPDLNAMVDVDHTFIYEHIGKMTEKYYKTHVTLDAKVPYFLQDRKYRKVFSKGKARNGDTFVKHFDMREINFKDEPSFKRVAPVPYIPA